LRSKEQETCLTLPEHDDDDDEVLMYLLELRTKRMLVCIKYIGALDRGLVPTLGFLTLRVLTHLMTVLFVKRGAAYTWLTVSDHVVTLIPYKHRYTLQLSAKQ
jgi:hypothetical protein